MLKFLALAFFVLSPALMSAQDRYRDYPMMFEGLVEKFNEVNVRLGKPERLLSEEIKKRVRGGVVTSFHGKFTLKCTASSAPVSIGLVLSESAAKAVSVEHRKSIFTGLDPASAGEAYVYLSDDGLAVMNLLVTLRGIVVESCEHRDNFFAVSFWTASNGRKIFAVAPTTKEVIEQYR